MYVDTLTLSITWADHPSVIAVAVEWDSVKNSIEIPPEDQKSRWIEKISKISQIIEEVDQPYIFERPDPLSAKLSAVIDGVGTERHEKSDNDIFLIIKQRVHLTLWEDAVPPGEMKPQPRAGSSSLEWRSFPLSQLNEKVDQAYIFQRPDPLSARLSAVIDKVRTESDRKSDEDILLIIKQRVHLALWKDAVLPGEMTPQSWFASPSLKWRSVPSSS